MRCTSASAPTRSASSRFTASRAAGCTWSWPWPPPRCVALLTGLVCLRTSGMAFIMITLAFAQMFYFLAVSLKQYGGDDGLGIAARSDFGPLFDLEPTPRLYYVALGLLSAFLYASWRLVHSRFGMVLRGAKSNERRMRALGFPMLRYRLAAYVLAGCVCVVAGLLLANLAKFATPAYMAWTLSGELIVMVVLGGMGTRGRAAGRRSRAAQSRGDAARRARVDSARLEAALDGGAGTLDRAHRAGGQARALRSAGAKARKPMTGGAEILAVTGLTKRFGGLAGHRRREPRRRDRGGPRGHRSEWRRQDHAASNSSAASLRPTPAPSASTAETSPDGRCIGARWPGWRAPTRSRRSCPSSRRWRTSCWRYRPASGHSFRFWQPARNSRCAHRTGA